MSEDAALTCGVTRASNVDGSTFSNLYCAAARAEVTFARYGPKVERSALIALGATDCICLSAGPSRTKSDFKSAGVIVAIAASALNTALSWRTRSQKLPPLEPRDDVGSDVVVVAELAVFGDVDEVAVFADDPQAAATTATNATVQISFRAGSVRGRKLSP
jgi:hypothetical protein